MGRYSDDSVIKESDLIQFDGAIDTLIQKIEGINTAFSSAADRVHRSAARMAEAINSTSGATKTGRNAIMQYASEAENLAKVQFELKFAQTEIGKSIAEIKAKTSDINKATVEQAKLVNAAIGSYDRLKAEVKELTSFYNSLTEEERAEVDLGGAIADEIRQKTAAYKEISNALKPVIEQISAVQKAEKELAFLQSEEGQRLIELRKQISDVKKARQDELDSENNLSNAKKKLNYARSDENKELELYKVQTADANKEAKLLAAVQESEAGSVNRLAAEYNLARFQIRNINTATEEGQVQFKALAERIKQLRAQLQLTNEQFGDYTYSVGRYENAMTGLGFQVQQVVRELPAAAVSLNTFFLAISNNIPMLVDEVRRLKTAGKTTQEVIKGITNSLFSWQTALVVVLAVLSKFGKQITGYVSNLVAANNETYRLKKVTKELKKELETANDGYGESMLKVRKLTDEFKALEDEESKADWIKAHEADWRALNVQIDSAADFENIFIKNTEAMKKAFKQRALAAAASKLMEEKFVQALEEESKLEQQKEKVDYYKNLQKTRALTSGEAEDFGNWENAYNKQKKVVDGIYSEIDILYEQYSKAMAKSAETLGTTAEGNFIDIAKRLDDIRLKLLRKGETAATNLQQSEFAKRRSAAEKEYKTQTAELQAAINDMTRLLKDPYKKLTDEQKAALVELIKDARQSQADFYDVYLKTLNDIAKDEQINQLQIQETNIQNRLESIKEGSKEEYRLKSSLLKLQMEAELLENSKLVEAEQKDEEAIRAKYRKKQKDLDNEFELATLEVQNKAIELKLEGVKKNSAEELELRLAQLEIQKQIEIKKNNELAEEERQDEADIIAKYNKLIEDLLASHEETLINNKLKNIRTSLAIQQKGSEAELQVLLAQIELERQAAILANKNLAEELRISEEEINAYYKRMADIAKDKFNISASTVSRTNFQKNITEEVTTTKGLIKYGQADSRKRELINVQLELDRIKSELKNNLELSEEQKASYGQQVAALLEQEEKLKGINGVISDIADGGITGGILGALGFGSDAVDATQDAINSVIGSLSELYDAEVELAEKEVELAEERVSAAQSALDAELTARANGYANNVSGARRELELEKKKQKEKEQILAAAQRKQEQLNSITQISSLITAAAQIWQSMSSVGGLLGPGLAIAAIAAMFGSYISAKAKARQVASQAYGEGGLEILEGGSHASGNDIDLHTKNSKGKNMRAEGGEAMAIINKRNTKKYRKVLPEVISSLNNGTFQDKYIKAFSTNNINDIIMTNGYNIDLSTIENEVRNIRKQSETKVIVLSDGSTLIQDRNVKRIIHKS